MDFSRINEYRRTGVLPPKPDVAEIKRMIKKHAQLQLRYKGEYLGIREMRKHVAWYTTGLKDSAALRNEVNLTESMDELFELLDKKWLIKYAFEIRILVSKHTNLI